MGFFRKFSMNRELKRARALEGEGYVDKALEAYEAAAGRAAGPDRAKALRLLRASGLGALAQREWLYLSQGERQRVLIARALMAQPHLLILDEPCAGLDPVAREHFLQFIEELAERARPGRNGSRRAPALVLVTHHVEEITPAFTHALLLREAVV